MAFGKTTMIHREVLLMIYLNKTSTISLIGGLRFIFASLGCVLW